MKKSIFIYSIISFFAIHSSYAQGLTPKQMSDRSSMGLKGNVKSILYSSNNNDEYKHISKYTFNAAGNIVGAGYSDGTEVKREYVSDTRYREYDDMFNITYTSNTRKDKWDSQEGLYYKYTYDKKGRIISLEEWSNNSNTKTYTYNNTENLIFKETSGGGEGGDNWTTTKTYTYIAKDKVGNWTKRKVVEVYKVQGMDDPRPTVTTTRYTESAEIVYFP